MKKDTSDNKNIKKSIEESINITIEDEREKYDINWETLKKQNTDTIAYIKVNNTNINYIVVKGSDNDYYLTHNFNKEYNVAGWVFSDYRNHFDGTDKNIIIYGHDIKDGSMFGTLKNVLNKDWYENEENYKVILVTEEEQYEYQVFSSYSIIAEDYYIKTTFNDDSEFDKFVRELKSRSIYNYETEVSKDDTILTLSSCMGNSKKRVVLHAKLVKQDSFW